MAEQSLAATKRLYEALDKADTEAVVGLFDPSAEIVVPPLPPWLPAGYSGVEGAVDYFRTVLRALEETHFSVTEMRPSGDDWVAVIGDWWGQVRSTGREFNARSVHFWTFRDGKVVKAEGIFDTAGIMRAFTDDVAAGAEVG
ncbi:nuclear transport factor 2 family protein [Streptomyces sp. NPDC101151]|uniref:nuclear transport factor 2 family protein n=1 Tax=Streptomyces sp. NPDC101151 TaxID=3366115 RepID=UPI0038205D6B